jgi:hypothetical protein
MTLLSKPDMKFTLFSEHLSGSNIMCYDDLHSFVVIVGFFSVTLLLARTCFWNTHILN